MSTDKKTAAKGTPLTGTEEIFVGGSSHKSRRRSKRPRLLAIFLTAILLFAVGLVWWTSHSQPSGLIDPKKSVEAQVRNLSNAQLDELTSSKTDPSSNFAEAYAKALALSQKGDSAGAIKQYEAIIASGKATYVVYRDYAAELLAVGRKQEAIANVKKAIEMLRTDTKLDQAAKANEQQYLEGMLAAYEYKAAQP